MKPESPRAPRGPLASGEEDLENNEEVTYEGAEGPEARNVSRV
jgi:hypothetical protein